MKDDDDGPKSKRELYEIADKEGMFVCGDTNCMDKETGVDYSHIEYLESTGKINDIEASWVKKVWPHIWRPVENLMKNIVQGGQNNSDLLEEIQEWKESYTELATEIRIAKKFLGREMTRKREFSNYRKRELVKLLKATEKVINDEKERRNVEKMAKETMENDNTNPTGEPTACSDTDR